MVDFDRKYEAVFVETKLNPYCRIINVLDLETGEILLSQTEGDVQAAFANGYNACAAEVVISRQMAETGGEYRIVTDRMQTERVYCQGWYGNHTGGQKKRVGGKKSYIKFYPDKMGGLPNPVLLAALRLAPYVNTQGCLKPRGRHNPLDVDTISCLLSIDKKRCYRLLQEMRSFGLITKLDGAYYLNKDYIGRG